VNVAYLTIRGRRHRLPPGPHPGYGYNQERKPDRPDQLLQQLMVDRVINEANDHPRRATLSDGIKSIPVRPHFKEQVLRTRTGNWFIA
jgi:hypothetical protein